MSTGTSRTSKRFEVRGIDMYQASGPGRSDAEYTLAWFDDLEAALAFARTKAAQPHRSADPELCDLVQVYDHVEGCRLFSEQRPPG